MYGLPYDEGAVIDATRSGVPWPFALLGAVILTAGFWVGGLKLNDVFGGKPANTLGFGIGEDNK